MFFLYYLYVVVTADCLHVSLCSRPHDEVGGESRGTKERNLATTRLAPILSLYRAAWTGVETGKKTERETCQFGTPEVAVVQLSV